MPLEPFELGTGKPMRCRVEKCSVCGQSHAEVEIVPIINLPVPRGHVVVRCPTENCITSAPDTRE